MRWWTADQHYGHSNIIRFCARPYVKGGYPATGWMNADLNTLHNAVVEPDDDVWMLGDVIMGPPGKNFVWAESSVGRNTLVVGNHDKNFRRNGTPRPDRDDMYTQLGGFDTIIHGETTVTLADGTVVLVSHFPYSGDSKHLERYGDHRPTDEGMWLLHGHVHEKWQINGKQINVGVDAWAGKPVSEQTIIDIIHAGPTNRAPQPWTAN